MNEIKIPTRAEILEKDKWDLTHLFANVGKWHEDFAWLERTFSEIARCKNRVGESTATLAEVLEFEKQLDQKIERLYHYASLQQAEDSANPDCLARIAQLQNLLTKVSEAFAFVTPEIQAIDDAKFAQFTSDPALAPWKIKLKKIRRMKPHILSEREERLLALGDSALDGYDDAFSKLTDVDM